MKHANAEMIKAVADDTDLTIFCKGNSGKWKVACPADIFYNDSFLCLPQHNEQGQCLHWLNGGDVQINRKGEGFLDWSRPSREWMKEVSFMFDINQFRIKPKKEKRWLTYNKKSDCISSGLMSTVPECKRKGDQLIEIEVEV